jgi:hypothetical protein
VRGSATFFRVGFLESLSFFVRMTLALPSRCPPVELQPQMLHGRVARGDLASLHKSRLPARVLEFPAHPRPGILAYTLLLLIRQLIFCGSLVICRDAFPNGIKDLNCVRPVWHRRSGDQDWRRLVGRNKRHVWRRHRA